MSHGPSRRSIPVIRPVAAVLVVVASVAVLAGGCTVGPGGVGARSPSAPSIEPPEPAASPPAGGGTSGSSGSGAVSGDPGAGAGSSNAPSAPTSSDGGPLDPGTPTLVEPQPGRLAPHRTGATSIEPRVDGRRVTVRLTWWSGIAPCTSLDSVRVEREGAEIRLTIIEGADRLGVACIEIAQLKATEVDLGELEAGSYRISAHGEAPATTVTVP